MASRWRDRLLASTRGRVLALLRASDATVNELADALGLTDNAVRAHLAALERDGLIEQHGVRRGVGKPAHVYQLTADGEAVFPKAYAPVLSRLIDVLNVQLPPHAVESLLRSVGARLSAGRKPVGTTFASRVHAAESLLRELSGGASVERERGARTAIVRGAGCPLSSVVHEHPEMCRLVETLVAEVTGLSVAECCERNGRPRCAFRLS